MMESHSVTHLAMPTRSMVYITSRHSFEWKSLLSTMGFWTCDVGSARNICAIVKSTATITANLFNTETRCMERREVTWTMHFVESCQGEVSTLVDASNDPAEGVLVVPFRRDVARGVRFSMTALDKPRVDKHIVGKQRDNPRKPRARGSPPTSPTTFYRPLLN